MLRISKFQTTQPIRKIFGIADFALNFPDSYWTSIVTVLYIIEA